MLEKFILIEEAKESKTSIELRILILKVLQQKQKALKLKLLQDINQ